VWIENTHNRGGGRIQPPDAVDGITRWARENGLVAHLDGARLWNAAAATGIPADRWARPFDTISVCFSKGLGAPVGSALAGPRDLMDAARRHRKLFGGGMRQAGLIAAGALYALDHHQERLAEDHEHAQILAKSIRSAEGLSLHPDQVDTNILIFRVDAAVGTAAQVATALKQRGVWMLAVGADLLRAVTHLDISRQDAEQAARIIPEVAADMMSGRLQVAEEEPAY
jgi:threonine aldolase